MLNFNRRHAALLWALMASVLAIYLLNLTLGSGFNIQTNILRLLPADQDEPLSDAAFDAFSERNMRQLLFLVKGDNPTVARTGADELAAALAGSPHIDKVMLEVDASRQEATAEFVYDYRHQLLHESDATLLSEGQYADFAEMALAQFFSPVSSGLAALATTDPFLLSYRFSRAGSDELLTGMSLQDGYLQAEQAGNVYVLLTATLAQSPFDLQLQADVGSRLEALEAQWADSGQATELLRLGAMFYADYAFQTARSEVTLIGGSSILLVVALVTLAFFSLRPIVLVVLALGFGIGCGFSVARALFGEIHTLTIVFGASLIGVAVDYAFHYLAENEQSAQGRRLGVILPAISMGLISSCIGYAALATTPFPGLQQMAVFCIAGLCGAWLTVVLLFPIFTVSCGCSPWLLKLCDRLLGFSTGTAARAVLYVALCIPFLSVLMLMGRVAEDDIRHFQATDTGLQQQESGISQILSTPGSNQFYLATGPSVEALLKNLQVADTALEQMRSDGLIEDYLGLSSWLPGADQQNDNYMLYRRLYDSSALGMLVTAGLIDESEADAIRQSFDAERGRALTVDAWLQSPLGEQYADLWLGELAGLHAAMIPLYGITDPGALKDVNEDIIFVDRVATINEMINDYRSRVSMLLMLAATGIYVLLALRYGFRRAALAITAPLVAVSVALVGLQLSGEDINLFNTLALFLVLGVGVDYGVFFAEAAQAKAHTMAAILLSALTTMFSFGFLALSQTPVIHSFGLTMLLGIGTTLLLSPVTGQLLSVKGSHVTYMRKAHD